MAKRLTDTAKWQRPWFRRLHADAKLVWLYILDQCDHAGIWIADFDLASFQLGVEINEESFQSWFGDKVRKFQADKYWIESFFEFQYADAKDGFKAKQSALKKIQGLGLLPNPEPTVPNTIVTVPEQSKDCPSISISISKSISNQGGVGGDLTSAASECEAAWFDALKKHGVERTKLIPGEDTQLVSAVQRYGKDNVLLALLGAKYEPASEGFKPSRFISLSRILKPEAFQRFVNLGAQAKAKLNQRAALSEPLPESKPDPAVPPPIASSTEFHASVESEAESRARIREILKGSTRRVLS